MEKNTLSIAAITLSVVSIGLSVFAMAQRPDTANFVQTQEFNDYKKLMRDESMNALEGRLGVDSNHRKTIIDLIRKVDALEKQATPVSE